MNPWTDASKSIVPFILAGVVGSLVCGLLCGIAALAVSRFLGKRGLITPYYENKISSLGFTFGFTLGAVLGLVYAWQS